MNLWWICPNCNGKVDFAKQLSYAFEEDGEASFDAKNGLWMHTIECRHCGSTWLMNIGGINTLT